MANFLKIIPYLLVILSMSGCVSAALKQYREDIRRQCTEDAWLLDMSIEECYDELDIK